MSDLRERGLGDVADYYAARLVEHGETPRGVDWNGAEGQQLSFDQLPCIVDSAAGFSINDLCKRRYARNAALLHDYGLYEFTILLRKQP